MLMRSLFFKSEKTNVFVKKENLGYCKRFNVCIPLNSSDSIETNFNLFHIIITCANSVNGFSYSF